MTYFESWLKQLERNQKSANTIMSYSNDVSPILNFKFGSCVDQSVEAYSSFNVDDLNEYFDASNFKPATICRKIASIQSFYKFLINDKRILTSNPFNGMSRPTPAKPQSKALGEERALEILDTASKAQYIARNGKRDYAIMQIWMSVPVRKSEIQNMKISDYEGDAILLPDTKGNKNRRIPCTDDMKDAINVYLKIRDDKLPWLFISEQGGRMSRCAIDNVAHKYAQINPHALRATSGSNLYSSGVDIATIKDIGGWDPNSRTFETHYLVIPDDVKKDAVEEAMRKMREKKELKK